MQALSPKRERTRMELSRAMGQIDWACHSVDVEEGNGGDW
jgi:hypothetical protein